MNKRPDKFLVAPGDTESEIYKANEAWDTFLLLWRTNRFEVGQAIADFQARSLLKLAPGAEGAQDFDDTPERLEAELGQIAPQLIVATNGLRRALDGLTGMRIAWNDVGRQSQKEGNFEEADGWVKGNMIGPETTLFLGFAAFLEIGFSEDAERGVYVPLDDMANIRPFDKAFFE